MGTGIKPDLGTQLDCFEETKEQIIKVQLWLAKAMHFHKKLQTVHSQYQLPQIFYRLRNSYEGLRIRKKELIVYTNQVLNTRKNN